VPKEEEVIGGWGIYMYILGMCRSIMAKERIYRAICILPRPSGVLLSYFCTCPYSELYLTHTTLRKVALHHSQWDCL
jgi:hypothetical protein